MPPVQSSEVQVPRLVHVQSLVHGWCTCNREHGWCTCDLEHGWCTCNLEQVRIG
eukprot:m.83051 g.83051  ORF g.83051 m.83051 type:complete len:54 (-) comp8147_c1_seq1:608-769(-)